MPRELQPCGTRAAYKRHLRHGEEPCDKCAAASREASRTRREVARRVSQATIAMASLQARPAPLNQLDDARENLALVTEAMKAAPVQALAQLSKRRQDLAREVARLEVAQGAGAKRQDQLGELMQRIEKRRAQGA